MKNKLENFLEYLKLKNFSPATIETRRQGVESFSHWFESRGKSDVREVTFEDLGEYLLFQQNKGFSRNSIDTRIRSIQLFFKYLEKQQIILINPAERLELPSLGKRLPVNILSEEEVRRILQVPNLGTNTGIRDRAVMELLYSSAIRRSEIAALKIFDVDLEGGYVRVNKGKGSKDRVLPLGKKASEYLKLYIEKVRPGLMKDLDSESLFPGYKKEGLNSESINRLIQRNARLSGVEKPVSIHSFRRAAVTHMLKNGAGPLYIQKMLGHSTGETMRKYLKVSIPDVKAMHSKKHPGERKGG